MNTLTQPYLTASQVAHVVRPAVRGVLQQLSPDGIWLAGGAARKLMRDELLGGSDLDIFFRTVVQRIKFVTWLLEEGAKLIDERKNNKTYQLGSVTVQVIDGNYYGSIDALLSSFDFTLCQFAFDGREFHYTPKALLAAKSFVFSVNKITLPLYSLARVHKYVAQGFIPDADMLMQLARAAQLELQSKGEGGSVGT